MQLVVESWVVVVEGVVQHLDITWPPQLTTVIGIGLKVAKDDNKAGEIYL